MIDPRLARRLDPVEAQQRIRRHSDVRILLLVLPGAVVLSVGVATMSFSVVVGSLTAGPGWLLLALAVRTAHAPGFAAASSAEDAGHNQVR